jgi:hypothetical protein
MASTFRVLLRPAVIVPEMSAPGKPTIADEGSIVELMDQRVLFRDRVSPVTRNADEILVRWGPKGKEALGWLGKNIVHSMKPVNGPLFLVKTKDSTRLSAWGQLRWLVASADARMLHKKRWWLVPWLLVHAKDNVPLLQKAIRDFGGRQKTDDPDVLSAHLVRLVTGQETDMATARSATKGGKKAAKKAGSKKDTKQAKKGTKHAKPEKEKAELPPLITQKNAKLIKPRATDIDEYTVRRLIKENPRRKGTKAAKKWDILKKGMTVADFIDKGGKRSTIAKYVRKGWVKLTSASTE